MHETGKKLLNLMFKPGESICVGHNKYAYHSIPLENVLNNKVKLVPSNADKPPISIDSNDLTLVALNPIKGLRNDGNVTAYRNFLVEMDNFDLKSQLEYINNLKMPYSGVVFSGNKSLHFLIALKDDLGSEKKYRTISEWILNIVSLADRVTKNASRSIRIPGVKRKEGLQRLVKINDYVKFSDLISWLQKYPNAKPKKYEKKNVNKKFNYTYISPWCLNLLNKGLDPNKGRNNQWYAIAVEFMLQGMSEDDTINILGEYFTPEKDFSEREWLTTVKSAFKRKI